MGNCGSDDAVVVTATTSNSDKPTSRPPTARVEPTTSSKTSPVENENNNSKSEKVLSRPVSPRVEVLPTTKSNDKELANERPHSSAVKAVSNGSIKNDHETTESADARKASAKSQKSQKEQSRAPSAQPLWTNPPTLPAEHETEQHN